LKISDETKVGVLAAFGLAIMIIGYSFLKGNNIFEKKFVLYAVYEKVDGLNQSDQVRINGLPVGRVRKLSLMQDGTQRILAEIQMNDEIVVYKNSRAVIESADLLGTKQISLVIDTPGVIAHSGDTIRSFTTMAFGAAVEKQLLPVKVKAEQLLGSIDSVFQIVQGILAGGGVERSLNNLDHATGSFAHLAGTVDTLLITETGTIKSILGNLKGFTGNLNDNKAEIDAILSNLAAVTDSLAKSNIPGTINTLDNTLKDLRGLMGKIDNGEGTMGKLISDPAIYNNLEKATNNLDALLIDIKANPARYVHVSVFGRKEKTTAKQE
jgi:phospholipid/cholesterol/gamma-HCH transport system substrate-binding protein